MSLDRNVTSHPFVSWSSAQELLTEPSDDASRAFSMDQDGLLSCGACGAHSPLENAADMVFSVLAVADILSGNAPTFS